MKMERAAGTLLHISSLPGPYGVGDMGTYSYQFIDFLYKSGQKYWQILPTGATGHGYSPYQAISAFAGNPIFINLDKIVEMGLLNKSDIKDIPEFNSKKADYSKALNYKISKLRLAFQNFKNQSEDKKWECYSFNDYQSKDWLDDYSLFKALKDHFNGTPWFEWKYDIKVSKPDTLDYWRAKLGDEIYFNKFLQYLYFKQIGELKDYANSKGIKIVGDIPIFVAYDSADVWANSHLFHLDNEKKPYIVAGVPPDYFSKTGQLWGNPLYRWDKMAEDHYLWWRKRFEVLLKQSDLIRLDHFRAFEAYWEIPADSETAINGHWVKGPNYHFFDTIKRYMGDLPLIAEDLGVITEDVENLRDNYNFPGMKILQFAFGDSPRNPFLPHNHIPNSVVYTGTHDNDTIVGWFKDVETNKEDLLNDLKKYIKDINNIHWTLIEMAFSSVSKLAIIPMQDFLGLDNSSRMNIPGTIDGNWEWRLKEIPTDLTEKIKKLVVQYNRTGE